MSHSKSCSLSLSGRHPAGFGHKVVPTESLPWQSVFGQVFDVVVIGAGAIGFAAARELASEIGRASCRERVSDPV